MYIDEGGVNVQMGDFHFDYFYQYSSHLYSFEYSNKGSSIMHSILVDTETLSVECEIFDVLLSACRFTDNDVGIKIPIYDKANICGIPYIPNEESKNGHGINYKVFHDFYEENVLGKEKEFIGRLLVESIL